MTIQLLVAGYILRDLENDHRSFEPETPTPFSHEDSIEDEIRDALIGDTWDVFHGHAD